MSKYDPLRDYLRDVAKRGRTEETLSFREVERILDFPLPSSAYDYAPWWGNDKTHTQARAWLDAGWEVVEKDLASKKVTFQRIEPKARQSESGAIPVARSFIVTHKCCAGEGKMPDPIDSTGKLKIDCKFCGGTGSVNLTGSRGDYTRCGSCKGTGRIWDDFHGVWKAHELCKGTGLVKAHKIA